MTRGSSKKTSNVLTERKFSWLDFVKGVLIIILGGILLVLIKPDTVQFLFNSSQMTTVTTPKSHEISSNTFIITSPIPSIKPYIEATETSKLPVPTNSGRTIHVPIFYFHYIGYNANPKTDPMRTSLSITPDNFEKILIFITQNGYTPITLDTLYNALQGKVTLPPKAIVLTFDDGYIDFYVNAYPLLKKYNVKATAFIATGLVGQAPYVHWEQIKEMDQSGLISIEAHSVTHPELTRVSAAKMKWEITQSKQMLENYLHHPVNFFAYPYGLSNPTVQQEVKATGFLGAVGTWGGEIESEGTLFNMPRLANPGGMSVLEFENRLTDMHLK